MTQNATQFKLARAVGLQFDHEDSPRVTAVTVVPTDSSDASEEVLPASCVLLATGPWSSTSTSWLPARCLPSRRFGGHRAHGVVIRPCPEAAASKPAVDATCLFMDYNGPGRACSPEVYPRPDGTVYMCGLSDNEVSLCSVMPTPLKWRWSIAHLPKVSDAVLDNLHFIWVMFFLTDYYFNFF